MATKKAKETDNVMTMQLPGIDIGFMTVNIVGDSPLIVHKWSAKAKKEMLDKQMKKASAGKDAKNPVKDFVDAIYWLDENGNGIDTPEELENVSAETPMEDVYKVLKNGKYGFPTCAFKACAIDAGY